MNRGIDYSNKRVYQNSVLSLLYKIVSMMFSFISAPLLLKCLGESKYGVWVTLGSIISWIYYSDLGIGSGLRNKLADSLAKDNLEAAKGYIAISYILLSGISFLFFCIFCLIVNIIDIPSFFKLSIDSENITVCLVAAMLLSCLNFVLSLVNNIAYAEQRASLVSFFNLIGQGLFVVLLFLYIKSGISLILFVALGEGVCQVIKNIFATVYVFKKYPELRVNRLSINKSYSKGILSFGLLVFISQISSLIHNTTDNLLISSLFGVSDVTPYNICYKYFCMINNVYLVLLTPLVSAYTVAKAKHDFKWIKTTMKKSMILFAIFFVGIICAVIVFEPFADIWLGEQLQYDRLMIITTAVYFTLLILSHNTTSLQTGLSDLKMSTIAVGIGSIINIPASIFCAKTLGFGVTGVVLGSVISMIPTVGVGIYKYLYYLKRWKK